MGGICQVLNLKESRNLPHLVMSLVLRVRLYSLINSLSVVVTIIL